MDKNEIITKMYYNEGRSLVVLASDLTEALKQAAKTANEKDLREAQKCAERIEKWVKEAA